MSDMDTDLPDAEEILDITGVPKADETPFALVDTWKYSPSFKMKIALLWYQMGKPSPTTFIRRASPEILKDEFTGNTLDIHTLHKWVWKEFQEYIKGFDQELQKYYEVTAITTRKEAIDRWAEQGKKLQDMGMKYFDEHEITNARAALAAVVEGWKMEQTSRAIPLKEFAEVARLSNEDLLAGFAEKLRELNEGQIIDITPVEQDDGNIA